MTDDLPPDEGPDEAEPEDDSEETFEEFYREQRNAALHQLPDENLVRWVAAVEKQDATLGVTLMIGGIIITGTLVSSARWFSELAELAEQHENPQWSEGNTQALRERALAEQVEVIAEHATDSYRYLHIVDAVTHGASTRPFGQFRWRVRLASIDAWTLGVMEPGE
jgi:hypothetical protein